MKVNLYENNILRDVIQRRPDTFSSILNQLISKSHPNFSEFIEFTKSNLAY